LPRKPNFLINEKSPYLQEHAFNPVEWRPWGDDALKKAKNDGKPIFLSIGYSTCHWCHQLARESFEDEAIAALINKNFIPIKVDREERPELDAYYMKAVQAMTGGGGWPLTVFLTPELKPFYGGTYFPPEPRYGLPSFRQVLELVTRVWRDKRAEAVENAEQIVKTLSDDLSRARSSELKIGLLDDGYTALVSSFDPEHGGFGGAPKFPLPLSFAYLLRYHYRTGKELALKSVTKTLDEIMAGGIRDHVGGGFHRYSTDRVWLVPHFEKMLYDNAQLARLYTEAYQATGKKEYATTAKETLDWILGEMRDEGGGFYSAQDADTEDGEGAYYTWTPLEVQKTLGKTDAAKFSAIFGVTNNGNFGGRSILHRTIAESKGLDHAEVISKWKLELYGERKKKPRSATDTKILTSWNGLAISALAFAGTVMENDEYVAAAVRAAKFIMKKNAKDGRLLRRFAGGEAALDGTLEDYAFFVQGLLDLFEATALPMWLAEAIRLTDLMVSELEDKENGGLFFTVSPQPTRLKEGYDGVTPSGNSVAAVILIRLAELTGRDDLKRTGERVMQFFGKDIEQQPTGHTNMLIALDMLLNGMTQIVITSKNRADAADMTKEVWRSFLPNKVVLSADSQTHRQLQGMTTLLHGRNPTSKPRTYLCRNSVCKLPSESASALRAQLSETRG
jgi:hypothetical protein